LGRRRCKLPSEQARFVRVRKGVDDAVTELQLLRQFLALNATAVDKIVKKFDKRTGADTREAFAARLRDPAASPCPCVDGASLQPLLARAEALQERVGALEPLHAAWAATTAYTIGCFDLVHHGHINLLRSMRQFGRRVVVGIHDDASYRLLKGKAPVDCLQARIDAIRPLCDAVFVIADTDPTAAIQGAVDLEQAAAGHCVYVRGDDMPDFPAKEWVEGVMEVVLLPRTESVSSSFIRLLYHQQLQQQPPQPEEQAHAAGGGGQAEEVSLGGADALSAASATLPLPPASGAVAAQDPVPAAVTSVPSLPLPPQSGRARAATEASTARSTVDVPTARPGMLPSAITTGRLSARKSFLVKPSAAALATAFAKLDYTGKPVEAAAAAAGGGAAAAAAAGLCAAAGGPLAAVPEAAAWGFRLTSGPCDGAASNSPSSRTTPSTRTPLSSSAIPSEKDRAAAHLMLPLHTLSAPSAPQ
jgi:cytidyltransferase-like protein